MERFVKFSFCKTSECSAALVFIGILVHHCFREVGKNGMFKHLLAKCVTFVTNADHNRGGENSEGVSDGSIAEIPQQPTVSVIAMTELCESLLTDN